MTLTVGTNSYISVSDATSYFNDSLSSDSWSGLDPVVQAQSLITAARMIDRQTWQGIPTSGAAPMQWPRTGVVDRYGNLVNSASVPQQIKDAQCELALAIQADPSVQTVKNQDFNTKTLKAGSAEITYMRPIKGGKFPQIIQELIGQFLSASTSFATPVVTGNCDESHFDKSDPEFNYDVVRGFS